jgi:hypothetical protein
VSRITTWSHCQLSHFLFDSTLKLAHKPERMRCPTINDQFNRFNVKNPVATAKSAILAGDTLFSVSEGRESAFDKTNDATNQCYTCDREHKRKRHSYLVFFYCKQIINNVVS